MYVITVVLNAVPNDAPHPALVRLLVLAPVVPTFMRKERFWPECLVQILDFACDLYECVASVAANLAKFVVLFA